MVSCSMMNTMLKGGDLCCVSVYWNYEVHHDRRFRWLSSDSLAVKVQADLSGDLPIILFGGLCCMSVDTNYDVYPNRTLK